MNINDIIKAIANGDADGHTEAIYDAIRQRQHRTTALKAVTITIGQRVKIVRITPAWLNDLTGKVVSLPHTANSKRFDVELDEEPVARFNRRTLRPETKLQRGIPAACLEVL